MTAQRHRIVVEGDDATNYSAYSPDVPGVVATGATREECEREMRAAIEFHLEGLEEGDAGDARPLLEFEGVSKRYEDVGRSRVLLDRVSFEIRAGTQVGVLGGRRSGKSTLLRIAAGLNMPDEGSIRFEGHDLTALSARRRTQLTCARIAWIGEPAWPSHDVKAVKHVVLPLLARGLAVREAEPLARRMLERVEMGDRAETRMHSLPLADRLRVALAHALALQPSLLLVDEPAVMPSERELGRFLDLLQSSVSEQGMTLMVASEALTALLDLEVLMSISEGEVHTIEREAAEVIDFPTRSAGRNSRSNKH